MGGSGSAGRVPRWRRFVAMSLAALVLLAGLWAATREDRKGTPGVVAARAVSTGAVLGAADLRLDQLDPSAASGVVSDISSVEGRVALADLAAGAPVELAQTAAAESVADRTPLAVDAVWIADGLEAGQSVTVVVSPTAPELEGFVLADVPLLGLDPGSGPRSGTLAVTSRQLKRLATLLSNAEIRITRAY